MCVHVQLNVVGLARACFGLVLPELKSPVGMQLSSLLRLVLDSVQHSITHKKAEPPREDAHKSSAG